MSMLPLIFAILIVVFALAYSFVWVLCRAAARADDEAEILFEERTAAVEEEAPVQTAQAV